MEIIGKGPRMIGSKNNLQEKDLLKRETYKRIKNMTREELSSYVKNLYHKAFDEGFKIGRDKEKQAAKAKMQQAQAAVAPERSTYQPFTCWGRVEGSGTKLDGHLYLLSLWDWDEYEDFHLTSFGENDEEAEAGMMETLHDADEAYKDMLLDEFKELWDKGEYEAPGVYTIPLEKVSIVKIVSMEGLIAPAEEDPATAAGEEAEEGGEA